MKRNKPKYDVITFGAAMRDVFMRSRRFRTQKAGLSGGKHSNRLSLGSKIEIDEILFDTGGGATNSAVTFSRLGFRTAFVGRVGANDIRGKEIISKLKDEGVDTGLVQYDQKRSTAYSVILLSDKGDRTALIYRGASAYLESSAVPWRSLKSRWFYITSLGGNLNLLKKIAQHAKKNNIAIAWNPGMPELKHGRPKLLPFLRQATVLILNREEAALVAHSHRSNQERLLEDLCLNLPGIVIVTDGANGAVVCDNKNKYFAGTRPIKAINTTGAGDAFGSGFVAGYIKKGSLPYGLCVGVANAESIIQHIGAKAGLLRAFPQADLVKIRVERFPN